MLISPPHRRTSRSPPECDPRSRRWSTVMQYRNNYRQTYSNVRVRVRRYANDASGSASGRDSAEKLEKTTHKIQTMDSSNRSASRLKDSPSVVPNEKIIPMEDSVEYSDVYLDKLLVYKQVVRSTIPYGIQLRGTSKLWNSNIFQSDQWINLSSGRLGEGQRNDVPNFFFQTF